LPLTGPSRRKDQKSLPKDHPRALNLYMSESLEKCGDQGFITAGGDRLAKVRKFTTKCQRWWEIHHNLGALGILLARAFDVRNNVEHKSDDNFKKFLVFYGSKIHEMKTKVLEMWPDAPVHHFDINSPTGTELLSLCPSSPAAASHLSHVNSDSHPITVLEPPPTLPSFKWRDNSCSLDAPLTIAFSLILQQRPYFRRYFRSLHDLGPEPFIPFDWLIRHCEKADAGTDFWEHASVGALVDKRDFIRSKLDRQGVTINATSSTRALFSMFFPPVLTGLVVRNTWGCSECGEEFCRHVSRSRLQIWEGHPTVAVALEQSVLFPSERPLTQIRGKPTTPRAGVLPERPTNPPVPNVAISPPSVYSTPASKIVHSCFSLTVSITLPWTIASESTDGWIYKELSTSISARYSINPRYRTTVQSYSLLTFIPSLATKVGSSGTASTPAIC